MEIFESLSFQEKNAILKESRYLFTTADHQNFSINLYSWDRFFIEEYFDFNKEQTTQITITTARNLEKILQSISRCDLNKVL
jgi:hypothetical protein